MNTKLIKLTPGSGFGDNKIPELLLRNKDCIV